VQIFGFFSKNLHARLAMRAQTISRHQLADWKIDSYPRLLANSDTLERLERGESPAEIIQSWRTGLEKFHRSREAFLIYK
jgi:hypothetical protein